MREESVRETGLDASQRADKRIVRHPLDDVAACSSLECLMNILVAFVGSESDKLGIAMAGNDGADSVNTAHAGKPEIHQGDIRKVLFEELDSLFAASRLGNSRHIRSGLDDGCNAHPHDGMVIDNENPNFNSILISSCWITASSILALSSLLQDPTSRKISIAESVAISTQPVSGRQC
jgi:hypothetical protein